jgi:hypothetical protein
MNDVVGGSTVTCSAGSWTSWVFKGLYMAGYNYLGGVDSYLLGQGYWPVGGISGYYWDDASAWDGPNSWIYCPRSYFITGFEHSMSQKVTVSGVSYSDGSDKLHRIERI